MGIRKKFGRACGTSQTNSRPNCKACVGPEEDSPTGAVGTRQVHQKVGVDDHKSPGFPLLRYLGDDGVRISYRTFKAASDVSTSVSADFLCEEPKTDDFFSSPGRVPFHFQSLFNLFIFLLGRIGGLRLMICIAPFIVVGRQHFIIGKRGLAFAN